VTAESTPIGPQTRISVSPPQTLPILWGLKSMPVVAEAQPEPIETTSADGITTIISWKLDEQDRRVKVSLPVRSNSG